jgi:hypothetical protein
MSFEPFPTNYLTLDLRAWQEQGVLTLSPRFQRRSVWKPAAKSHFIDTLLRGFPVPPIHIRLTSTSTRGALREVVDGQQRLRTLFDFLEGKFRLGRQIESEWAGKAYYQLPDEQQQQITGYRFLIYQYHGIDDRTVLEIFARMNTYSVALNPQELRNGKYFGNFKNCAYSIGFDYLQFWRNSRILTESSITRMSEAELVSELLVAQLDGLQDKKSSLDDFYYHLDDEWGTTPLEWTWRKLAKPAAWLSRAESEKRFRRTMEAITEAVGDIIPVTSFSRVPLFYTLYTATYHRLFGLPGFDKYSPQSGLDQDARLRLRETLENLSGLLGDKVPIDELSGWRRDFVVASARQTDNVGPRRTRLETIWDQANLGD